MDFSRYMFNLILQSADKKEFEKIVKNERITLPTFVKICKEETLKYQYSFATKVFSFIDRDNYPILDSYVVTMLEAYNCYNYGMISKSKWGNYNEYKKNYNKFVNKFNLKKNFKEIDKFLWTYAKILEWYWEEEIGVLRFESVSFDKKTIQE